MAGASPLKARVIGLVVPDRRRRSRPRSCCPPPLTPVPNLNSVKFAGTDGHRKAHHTHGIVTRRQIEEVHLLIDVPPPLEPTRAGRLSADLEIEVTGLAALRVLEQRELGIGSSRAGTSVTDKVP